MERYESSTGSVIFFLAQSQHPDHCFNLQNSTGSRIFQKNCQPFFKGDTPFLFAYRIQRKERGPSMCLQTDVLCSVKTSGFFP